MLVQALQMCDKSDKVTDGVYLHGKLSEINGFDQVYIKDMPEGNGVYMCNVSVERSFEGLDPFEIPSVFFYWRVADRDRGLIVMLSDRENMRTAKEKFDAKSPYI